jgi:hypothetical protein
MTWFLMTRYLFSPRLTTGHRSVTADQPRQLAISRSTD